jgi:hypothetical protein
VAVDAVDPLLVEGIDQAFVEIAAAGGLGKVDGVLLARTTNDQTRLSQRRVNPRASVPD